MKSLPLLALSEAPAPDGVTDLLGQHLSQRLAGEPALTFGDQTQQ